MIVDNAGDPKQVILTNGKDFWKVENGQPVEVPFSSDAVFIQDLKPEDIEETKTILEVFANSKIWIDKQDTKV